MSEEHPNAISLADDDQLGEQSYEVARVWITNNAGSSIWINPALLDDPVTFGRLIADTIRHGAYAYSTAYGLDREAALQSIVEGIRGELGEPLDSTPGRGEGSLN